MEIKNHGFTRGIFHRWWLVAAACYCLPLVAFGQSISPATAQQLAQWWIVQGNTAQSVPSGTPGAISVPTTSSGTGPSAGGWTVEPVNNDWPDARAKSTPRGVPGGPVIDVKAKVKAAAVGAALGRAATKIVGVIAVGNAIYDLAKELDFILSRNPDGSLKVDKVDPSVCSVAPCWTYHGRVGSYPFGDFSTSQMQACINAATVATSIDTFYRYTCAQVLNEVAAYSRQRRSDGAGDYLYIPLEKNQVAPSDPSYLPSSRQAFEDAVAAKSGWPTSSAISRAIADAAKSGESIEVNTPRLSGPASIPGPVVTTNKPDGTTQTSTTTNNYSYAGDKVTYNTTTVTNNYNPTTNTTTTETTTTTPATEPEKQTECEQNPDTVGCAEIDTPEGEIPRSTRNVSFQSEDVWGSGSCPADRYATIHGKSLKVVDWASNCFYIATYLRPVLILCCSFAALLIAMPGRPD